MNKIARIRKRQNCDVCWRCNGTRKVLKKFDNGMSVVVLCPECKGEKDESTK